MGIKIFVNILLVLAIGAYFVPVENKINKNNDKDIPLVVFEEPLMYTLNKDSVTRIIQSSKAIRYKNRDEMFDGNIILLSDNEEYFTESIRAKFMTKKKNVLNLRDNVIYTRDNIMNLNTDELDYNLVTKVAKGSKPYTGKYLNSPVQGDSLYVDSLSNNMKSTNVHFEIEMKNKK